MKKVIHLFIYLSISFTCYSQVGIGTTIPAGMLEVSSGNDKELGLVVPIVAKLEDVRHVIAGEAVKRSTIIFDEQRNTLCHKTISGWSCLNGDNIPDDNSPINPNEIPPSTYIKASNTKNLGSFGYSLALSRDGNTLAVGASAEPSDATGVGGDQANSLAPDSGAVYIFTRSGTTWTQQAFIKASNNRKGISFGCSVALSDDGNTLAVGAFREASNATGIDGDQENTSLIVAGAVYAFSRSGTTWTQQAYIKASNTQGSQYGYGGAQFGYSVALSDDGNTLAVGANKECSNATGIDGDQENTSLTAAGAVYVFTRSGITWAQQAYIKASNTNYNYEFGSHISISSDGNTLAVASIVEASNATGINGNQTDVSTPRAGAVYIFTRSGTTWSQQAYVKASNTSQSSQFGYSVALSGDGNTLAVGSPLERSNATGINGDQANTSREFAGAVYVFTRSGTTWSQQAYVKASRYISSVQFGHSVSLSNYGNTLAVGGVSESSNATGINGDQDNTLASMSGAVYVFTRSGTTWTQKLYVKASNTGEDDNFGYSVALSDDGNTLAVGSTGEESNATGINGNQANNSFSTPGAVYAFKLR